MMEKLSMCRICLVENVRMHAVVNKSLQELYEKLTDIPFITEDARPMLACFFCCTKIKQCAQFQKKCLETEQLFAQMLNEEHEPNPSLNHGQLEFSGGYVTTPVELISIDTECQEESDIIKQEPPDVCKRQHYIIEPKEEYQSDELKLKHIHNRYSDVEGIAPHQSESEDIQPQYSQEDSEDKFTFIEFKTEVVEDHDISTEEQRTREMIWVPDVMVSRLDLEATQPEDTITYKQQENEQLDLGRDQNTQNLTSKLVPKLVKNLVQQNDYKCNICKRIFGNKANLTIHMRTHTGEKPFNCNICQRNFSQSGHLKAHTKIHTGEKPYKCDICQQTYRQKGYLKNHMRIHTGDTRYKCDICQASFNFRANYTKHLRVHTKIIPYKCNVCQSSFDQECHLKSHLRLHNDVNKHFKCEICQRWFKNEAYLRRHIRNHSGKKPYKCDICHRGFRDMANLTGHMRTHTGEKPFICDICQRGFRQKVHLTKHIITHTYESSYSCDVCRRSFSRIRYLNMHIRRTHDAEKLFKCDICQRCFRRKSYLGRHIRKHHSM